MSKPRLANLLDDFGFGGVSRGLGIFDSETVREAADCAVVAVKPDAVRAPRLDAEIIVLHFPPNWRRIAFLISLRMRNPKARIIHVEHSYTPAWEALKVAHRGRFRLMLRVALRLVDQVVCVSRGQANWLRQVANLPAHKVEVIHPYAKNAGLEVLPLPNFDAARPLVLAAYGRFHEQKGLENLITAHRAGALPNTQLVVGGFGPLDEDLRALAGDASDIRFAGRINDVAAFLGGCDVVVVPSRWEAYGQVATEAREAGRPILVAPVDGLPEQVGEAGLVIDFTKPDVIAKAFATLTPGRLSAMAKAARRSTVDCGPSRQRDWARLIRRLAPQAAGSRRRAVLA
ncbi:MAG: glycosyltransferase family 4 protein [Novosphingobium sp.]|nr:glycosyltransferase family 4 protein [Novosphingobium sp.]